MMTDMVLDVSTPAILAGLVVLNVLAVGVAVAAVYGLEALWQWWRR